MRRLPVLRASSTERWLNCTWFSSHEWPEGESSEAAERGRRVHAGIAKALGCKSNEPLPVSDDERALVDIGVTYAKHLMDQALDWTVYVEQTMELDLVSDSFKGTADLVLVNGQRAVLVDWKTGQRHSGYEPQMLTYAYLLSRIYGVTQVDVRLVYLASGEEDQMSISSEQIAAHAEAILVASSRRTEEQPVATPGGWCQWCPGSISCPKNAAIATAVTDASMLRVDVSKLAVSVDDDDEAAVAHALVAYATEVAARIETNLKDYVRKRGRVLTREGRAYGPSTFERSSLEMSPEVAGIIETAGAGDCLKVSASWADIKKKLAKNAVALEQLESALRECGALKFTTQERWTTK